MGERGNSLVDGIGIIGLRGEGTGVWRRENRWEGSRNRWMGERGNSLVDGVGMGGWRGDGAGEWRGSRDV